VTGARQYPARSEARLGRLDGKVALITGAARGQGAAGARALVAEGARAVLSDVLEEGVAVAGELGTAATFLRHDVANEADWAAAVALAVERFGRLDVLVNNAGLMRRAALAETSSADFERHFRVNQLGLFLGMRAALEPMRAAGGGSIINVASVNALRGTRGSIAYTSTKWAVRGLTQCAALELAPYGIRVNTINPGLIETRMIEANGPEHNRAAVARTPLGRIGTVEDVTAAVVYLASGESAFVTGAEITVDGGVSV
jgi:3alpha(or 20beta)-hydroxysteroid dehydrogenase